MSHPHGSGDSGDWPRQDGPRQDGYTQDRHRQDRHSRDRHRGEWHHLTTPLGEAVCAHGGTLERARPRQVTWWPGRSLTVTWDTVTRGGPHPGPGRWVGTTVPPPAGGTFLGLGPLVIGELVLVPGRGPAPLTFWPVPHDPFLPGLPAALQPEGARLRAYRPRRRAVIDTGGAGPFAKVLRPHRLAAAARLHQALRDDLRVPEVLDSDPQTGRLLLRRLPGATLRAALSGPSGVPTPEAIAAIPGRIPPLAGLGPVDSPIESAPRVAGVLGHLLPAAVPRIDRVLSAIGTDDVTARVPVHGDFHPAQVLVTDGTVSGVLDVESVGWGRPGDDPATMLAHLAVWQTLAPNPARVAAYAARLQQLWEAEVDPADLRRRTAARLLGLASGPFRVQQRDWPHLVEARLALAEQWAAHAALAPDS